MLPATRIIALVIAAAMFLFSTWMYSRTGDWTLEDESAGTAAGNFASVAPGDSWAGVFSIQQGDEVFFGRLGDSYVDWHRLLRLDPGTYTVGYYVNHHGLLYRWDQLQLHAGHRYQVGWRSCTSWTPERGRGSAGTDVTGKTKLSVATRALSPGR